MWACTHNYDSPGIPGDGYGIMKSTDLATWTGVLRYQDINGVVAVPEHARCRTTQCVDSYMGKPSVWCCLERSARHHRYLGRLHRREQLRDPGRWRVDDGGNTMVTPPPKGCCNAGGSAAGRAVLGGRHGCATLEDEGDANSHAVALRSPRISLAASVVHDQRDGDAGGGADRDPHAAPEDLRATCCACCSAGARSSIAATSRTSTRGCIRASCCSISRRGATCASCRGCSPTRRTSLRRKHDNNYKDIPAVDKDRFPPYYRRTFHWQSGGYFSDFSAADLRARRRAVVPRHRRRDAPPDHPADHALAARRTRATRACSMSAAAPVARCISSRARIRDCGCTAPTCRRRTSSARASGCSRSTR